MVEDRAACTHIIATIKQEVDCIRILAACSLNVHNDLEFSLCRQSPVIMHLDRVLLIIVHIINLHIILAVVGKCNQFLIIGHA